LPTAGVPHQRRRGDQGCDCPSLAAILGQITGRGRR